MADLEKVKGGFLVEVPPIHESQFTQLFPKAKRQGEKWRVKASDGEALQRWADNQVGSPDQPKSVETDDIKAIDSQLENVGPDMVKRRILNRQKEEIIASRARRSA